jgi:hypothetical protein
MDNLKYYNLLSTTPQAARKEILAGRLKGMTDINPMWRIKKLTETFGMCGIGWKYVITSKKLENGCKGQISAFVDIDLFVKVDGTWSDAIQGTGGASFIADEKNGLYQNDECFKMALTDALGIACKALGMSSDIYFNKDTSKYSQPAEQPVHNGITQKDIELAEKELIKCNTINDLQTCFLGFSVEMRKLTNKLKDELKTKLTPTQNG